MGNAGKLEQVEAIFLRAAETLDDLTPHIFARYYAAHPQVRERFAYYSPDNPAKLEAEMVDQLLYVMLYYFDRPVEIGITTVSTVPHHIETLGISAAQFVGLLDAMIATIAPTIPPEAIGERAVWDELIAGLYAMIRRGEAQVRQPHAA